jgi:predicted neutral ceramidase superfamily lipid hydrolase
MEIKEQDRLTLVEVQVAKIETKLDLIQNNHLVHLQQDVTSVKKTQWWLFSTLIGCLVSLVILLVQSLF